MSNVSILGANISMIKLKRNINWGGKDNCTLIDERIIEKDTNNNKKHKLEKEISLENLSETYIDLKQNYYHNNNSKYADKFYVREREIERNYQEEKNLKEEENLEKRNYVYKKNWINRNLSFLGLYYHMSTYGENYIKPLIFGLLILIISTMYLSLHTNPAANNLQLDEFSDFTSNLKNSTHLSIAFERTLANFFQSPYKEFVLVDSLVKVFSLLLIGVIFMEALRNRLKRI